MIVERKGCGRMKRAAVWMAMLPLLALPHAAFAQARGSGIPTAADCASKPSKDEEIACLRQALEESRRALEGSAVPSVAESTAATGTQAPAAPPPPARYSRPELGAEQVKTHPAGAQRAKVAPEAFRVTVTQATTDARGVLTLHLDNGQVWREKEQPDVPLRLDEHGTYPAEISRSGFGGYRMRFPDRGRTIVVERIS